MNVTIARPNTAITELRQRHKDAMADHESRCAVRDSFERQRWFSRSRWQQLGYALKETGTHPIVQNFRTRRGIESFHAYHACDVQIRPGVWRKMVEACRLQLQIPCPPTLANRRRVHEALLASGQEELARRLQHSLITGSDAERDRSRLEWLKAKEEQAASEASVAQEEYLAVGTPMLEKRQATQARRDHLRQLADIGGNLSGIADDTPVSEILHRIEERRRELHRPGAIDSLAALGIDRASLPALIDVHEVLELVTKGGYLCTVPDGLDPPAILADVQGRDKALAAWALQRFPERIVICPCHNSPGRNKVILARRTPPQNRAHSVRRKKRRWKAENLRWQEAGF